MIFKKLVGSTCFILINILITVLEIHTCRKELDGSMRQVKKIVIFFCICLISTILFLDSSIDAAEEKDNKDKKDEKEESFTLPKNVMSITKTNTFPNTPEDLEVIEPSQVTKELLEDVEVIIENPELIKLINESTIRPSPLAIGYRANVFLGRWPLHYTSESTSVNWDYQQINMNEINNMGGKDVQEVRYYQQKETTIKGALTNKIENPDIIKKMILHKAKEKTNLALSFSTVIGENTKLDNYYNVPSKKIGQLKAYAPAINEKGHVVFGEVYIQLKGSSKEIIIKNVTKQGTGAWIPIQDHVSLSFQLK